MSEAHEADQVFELRRMARAIGVTSKWLKEEAVAGRVPCLKAGTRLLFSRNATMAALVKRADKERGPRQP